MNKRWTHNAAAATTVALIMLSASTAWGEWGEGIQGGPFILHPGVSLSAGFDSNLYYASPSDSQGTRQAPEGVVEPRLSISTQDAGNWDLDGEASVGWRQYFSDQAQVRDQSGLSANLSANAAWNQDGPFSLQFSENFVRTNETPNSPSSESINRIYNEAGIMAGLHPGGRILETYASYDYAMYRHSDLVSGLDRDSHQFGWQARWSFLPKTALMAEVDHRRIRYRQARRGGPDISPDGELRNTNSNPVRLLGGVEGLVTERISFGARAGYGWAMYDDGPNFEGYVARAEASYQFGNVDYDNRLRLGYQREFSDSSIGNFYTSHRAIAGYEQGFVDNRLRLGLEVDGQIRNYAEIDAEGAETPVAEVDFPDQISDLLVGVSADADYAIRRGWDVGLRYQLRSNFTDDVIEVQRASVPGEDVVRDYHRHHVLFTTQLTY